MNVRIWLGLWIRGLVGVGAWFGCCVFFGVLSVVVFGFAIFLLGVWNGVA